MKEASVTNETHEHRLKRLHMRSMRRGIKEMDLILVAFAKRRLSTMSDADLLQYDLLLCENDQDLYQWVTGQALPPSPYQAMIADISISLQKQG